MNLKGQCAPVRGPQHTCAYCPGHRKPLTLTVTSFVASNPKIQAFCNYHVHSFIHLVNTEHLQYKWLWSKKKAKQDLIYLNDCGAPCLGKVIDNEHSFHYKWELDKWEVFLEGWRRDHFSHIEIVIQTQAFIKETHHLENNCCCCIFFFQIHTLLIMDCE